MSYFSMIVILSLLVFCWWQRGGLMNRYKTWIMIKGGGSKNIYKTWIMIKGEINLYL